MRWDTEQSRQEIAWLGLMAKMKYDGYEDFRAGVRFVESLADWLQQFSQADRGVAYAFVRKKLVYIGPSEMNHIVELFFPETVQWRLQQAAAKRCGIPRHLVFSDLNATACYERLLHQTLFIELSDGARIDVFRRSNSDVVSNEQVITAPRIIKAKWDGALKDLREALGDPGAKFAFVFLVDDFVGSGTTLLRWNEKSQDWEGKLVRFWDDLEGQGVLDTHFEPDWVLCVHHYLATYRGAEAVKKSVVDARASRGKVGKGWFSQVMFSFGAEFNREFPVDEGRHPEFVQLAQTYYDDSVQTEHTKLGGDDMRLGFGKCALPLVLAHNTPNNTISLLWAETSGTNGQHAMRPLFRRRQRHT